MSKEIERELRELVSTVVVFIVSFAFCLIFLIISKFEFNDKALWIVMFIPCLFFIITFPYLVYRICNIIKCINTLKHGRDIQCVFLSLKRGRLLVGSGRKFNRITVGYINKRNQHKEFKSRLLFTDFEIENLGNKKNLEAKIKGKYLVITAYIPDQKRNFTSMSGSYSGNLTYEKFKLNQTITPRIEYVDPYYDKIKQVLSSSISVYEKIELLNENEKSIGYSNYIKESGKLEKEYLNAINNEIAEQKDLYSKFSILFKRESDQYFDAIMEIKQELENIKPVGTEIYDGLKKDILNTNDYNQKTILIDNFGYMLEDNEFYDIICNFNSSVNFNELNADEKESHLKFIKFEQILLKYQNLKSEEEFLELCTKTKVELGKTFADYIEIRGFYE